VANLDRGTEEINVLPAERQRFRDSQPRQQEQADQRRIVVLGDRTAASPTPQQPRSGGRPPPKSRHSVRGRLQPGRDLSAPASIGEAAGDTERPPGGAVPSSCPRLAPGAAPKTPKRPFTPLSCGSAPDLPASAHRRQRREVQRAGKGLREMRVCTNHRVLFSPAGGALSNPSVVRTSPLYPAGMTDRAVGTRHRVAVAWAEISS
jgi:hypothetical protein